MDPEDIQYDITRQWIDEFEADLRAIDKDTGMNPRVRQACREATKSMLTTLRSEAAEYEQRHGAYVPSPVGQQS